MRDSSKPKRTTSTLILWINKDFEELPATIHGRYDWAKNDSSIVWASLRYDHPALLPKLNPYTVLSFIPPGGRVWFILGTDTTKSHVEMLQYLGAKGLRFRASATYNKKDSRILQAGYVIANTNDSEIIQTIFNVYWMDWIANGHLFFVISDQDLSHKEQELENLPSLVRRDFLNEVNCVLATYYDHGLEVLTSTLKAEQVESIVKRVAVEFNLSFRVETNFRKGTR